jgi:hypothetical protein
MPRNVVSLAPRLIPFARPGTRAKIETALEEHYRYRRVDDHIEIDFPKSKSDAKQEVISTLDAISPAWRRVFVIYPR